jgi:hypothetical protein
VNIIRGKREHAGSERADGVGGGTLGRRNVLGGLAALPVLYSVGSATPALAASAVRPGSVPAAAGDLMRGAERPPATPHRGLHGDAQQPRQLPGLGHQLAEVAALGEEPVRVGLLEIAGADLSGRDVRRDR